MLQKTNVCLIDFFRIGFFLLSFFFFLSFFHNNSPVNFLVLLLFLSTNYPFYLMHMFFRNKANSEYGSSFAFVSDCSNMASIPNLLQFGHVENRLDNSSAFQIECLVKTFTETQYNRL